MIRLRPLVLAGGGLLAVLSLWRAEGVAPARVVDSAPTVGAVVRDAGAVPHDSNRAAGSRRAAATIASERTADLAAIDRDGDGGGAVSGATPGIVVPPPYAPVQAVGSERHELPGTSAAGPSLSAARITFVTTAAADSAPGSGPIAEPRGAIQPVAFEQPAGVETRGDDESRHGRSSGPPTSGFAVLTGRIEPFHDEP